MQNNPLEELARFALDIRYGDIPSNIIEETKRLLLDSIGDALGGITTDPGKMVIALAKRLGGPPESSIIGVGDKVSCTTAAFANGQLINTLDYDAVMAGGHVPPYIVASTLSIAESTAASGRDLILATALGADISARVMNALHHLSPASSVGFKWQERQGYANCNFGVAAGVGRLIHLDHNQMTNALGIAGHLCQVLPWIRQSFSDHRPMTKYGMPGWQNTGGLMAALLAEMGYMGDTTVFDDKEGFWKFAGYDGWNPEKLTEGLGKFWSFANTPYKPYPCCGVLHTAIDCFYSIMENNKLEPGDIDGITAYLPTVVEAPLFQNRELTNIVDIQFGITYILAIAANKIRIGPEWQDMDIVREPRIQKLAEKIKLQIHPDASKKPGVSRVEVSAKGQTYTEERAHPRLGRGGERQMTNEELAAKFRHNASRILTEAKIEGSIKTLYELETLKSVADLMKQVTLNS
jgi:2-methylcitrate dehydratase PrpD